jgi:hypothetical protein
MKHQAGLGGTTRRKTIMIRVRLTSYFVLACCGMLSVQCAQGEPRAVIELFTSQGCSSCPPADKLIAEYARDPSVIALSLAVDYWDYLGWKDTLALGGHSNRQRAYAKVRGDRQVYTPQAVIDGAVHALGSDKTAIERAIKQTRERSAPLQLPVTIAQNGDKLTVTVPASADENGQAEVWLCPLARSIPVVVGRGENSGHTLTYTNVVRRWIKLGDWTGKAETFDVSLKDLQSSGADSAAVIVQNGVASAPKLMLGAAQTALR